MNSFPENLNVSNKNNFNGLLDDHHISILRSEIFYHMLHSKENDFYDLDVFNKNYVKNMKKTHELVAVICIELKNLGWNTFLGFGDTGLYIYSSEEKPSGVY